MRGVSDANLLEQLTCPKCGLPLAAREGDRITASAFEDCLRRCDPCGVGWSNASRSPVSIWKDPLDNLPPPVRGGALDAFRLALNEWNRSSKLRKFGSSSSEDALTWTVFRFLVDSPASADVWRFLLDAPAPVVNTPSVLLWGVPISGPSGDSLRDSVISKLDALGESSRARTEPDVIVDEAQQGLAILEVKYRSGNDQKADGSEWTRYVGGTDAFADPSSTRSSGRYELARNWRLGCEVAAHRPFSLVNLLVRPETGAERTRTESFAASLAQRSGRRFLQLTFSDLLARRPLPWPVWFEEYAKQHGLRG